MPNDTSINLTPYTSTVPLTGVAQDPSFQQRAEPYPTQVGYVGKAGGLASIGDAAFKGLTKGLEIKEQHKAATANATISALDKNVQQAYGNYQQVASDKGVDSSEGKAAYDAYIAQFNQAKHTKAQYVIPEKPPKGQKQDKNAPAHETYSGWSNFFARNPHIIPEIALTAMQPEKPGLSTETQKTKNELQSQQNTLQIQGQTIDANKLKATENAATAQRDAAERSVEEAGGVDAVLKNPNATPEQQTAAKRIKYSALDKESELGKMKESLAQMVASGQQLTEGQRQIGGALGVVSEPKFITTQGKNGHSTEMAVDPMTGKPIPGWKPMDLGPPQWAQEFYARRSAARQDVEKAVRGNPEAYGVQMTGDKKTDDARSDAMVAMLIANHEEGVKATGGLTGKLPGEVYRDNSILKDVYSDIEKQIPAKGSADFQWTGGQKVSLDRAQMGDILGEFFSDPQETPGNYAFRSQARIPDGKDPQAVERDRQWAVKLVKKRMLAQKGKNALTSEQADAIIKNSALGQPITATAAPQGAQPKSNWRKAYEALDYGLGGTLGTGAKSESKSWRDTLPQQTQASPAAQKLYMVPGHDQPVPLTDEEAAKAKAANIQLQAVPEELLQSQ